MYRQGGFSVGIVGSTVPILNLEFQILSRIFQKDSCNFQFCPHIYLFFGDLPHKSFVLTLPCEQGAKSHVHKKNFEIKVHVKRKEISCM